MFGLKTKSHPLARRFWAWQARSSAYLFLLPFILLFAVFLLYPIVRSMALSFYRTSGPRAGNFVGLSNYYVLIHDRIFWLAVLNTVLYTALYLILYVPISLGLALLLNSPSIRFRSLFRFTFFSTHLVGNVFAAVIFALLFAPRQGVIDRAIGSIFPWGYELNWRGDSKLAVAAIVIASLWISIGYGMIYFLAALQSVDRELYEAAEIDGAGRLSQFWHVTLPSIKPVLIFILLVGTIGAIQLFEIPYVLFDPPYGPGMRTLTIVMYLYQQGFEAGLIGYAAAIGWVLVVLIFSISMVQLKLSGALRDI